MRALPRMGSRGQHWEVLQLLQGGVIAMVMLLIIYGVVQFAKDRTPSSDIYSVSCEILGSAYAARGTGEFFTREALLVDQEITESSLIQCSGLPSRHSMHVNLVCAEPYCLKDGESVDSGDCTRSNPCRELSFASGDTIMVCAMCDNDDLCGLWFGAACGD